jgi:hypothetical protein
MSGIFEKLNLKDQQEILVLRAPDSFLPEMAQLPVLTIHHHIESVPQISFFLGFVTRQSEVDALASAVAARVKDDATVWFAYPKTTAKKYSCNFRRETVCKTLKTLGFDSMRSVSIDEDWTAQRFRRVGYVESADKGHGLSIQTTEPATLAAEKTTEEILCKASPRDCAPRKPKSTTRRTTRI